MPGSPVRKSDTVIAYFSKASGIERRDVASLPVDDAVAKLQKLLRQQAALARFGSFALREWDLMKILKEAVRVCAEGLGAPFCKVCKYRAEENDLLIVAGCGWQEGVVGHVVSRADMSTPQGRAFATGEPSICDDLQKDAYFDLPPFYAAHGIVSIIDVIIKGSDDRPYGILEVDNDRQHDYDQYDINFLTGFANILAEGVATSSRAEALQVALERMKLLVEEKDVLLREKNAVDLQLRQAQKMEAVGQLTGGIAHDLNNILTVITGNIETLTDGVAGSPQLAASAKMIDEAAARGADLTQRLLAFARKHPLQPREVDVNSLIIEATHLLLPTLGAHIEIKTTLAPDAAHALIDPSQLTNTILNLALNARDAMPKGGKLTIETSNIFLDESYSNLNEVTAGDYVMIAVSDSGSGIPADTLEKVFEPFFTTKAVGKGTGLGLSMVYGFVKQSRGHIVIYSEEGRGTTVRIYLPQATGTARPSLKVMTAPGVERGRETILIVEDDHMVRPTVVRQIESLGYVALTAADAAEALTVIDGGQEIDLLFTDLIMPGAMNGRRLADEALRRKPSLKVLFTSGYSEDEISHNGKLDEGVLLLAKPYRKSDLARLIRSALAADTRLQPFPEESTGGLQAQPVLSADSSVRAPI
jgi:signal transduction histidine kinase/ActR/RegA family two-component response regulator